MEPQSKLKLISLSAASYRFLCSGTILANETLYDKKLGYTQRQELSRYKNCGRWNSRTNRMNWMRSLNLTLTKKKKRTRQQKTLKYIVRSFRNASALNLETDDWHNTDWHLSLRVIEDRVHLHAYSTRVTWFQTPRVTSELRRDTHRATRIATARATAGGRWYVWRQLWPVHGHDISAACGIFIGPDRGKGGEVPGVPKSPLYFSAPPLFFFGGGVSGGIVAD